MLKRVKHALIAMRLEPYRPSIQRLQEEWARRIARVRMLRHARKGNETMRETIQDNSEPWMEKPASMADLMEISDRIKTSEEQWLSRCNNSSIS